MSDDNVVPVGGIWLIGYGGQVRVLARVRGRWCVVIPAQAIDGPISWCVHPGGILDAPPDSEVLSGRLMGQDTDRTGRYEP